MSTPSAFRDSLLLVISGGALVLLVQHLAILARRPASRNRGENEDDGDGGSGNGEEPTQKSKSKDEAGGGTGDHRFRSTTRINSTAAETVTTGFSSNYVGRFQASFPRRAVSAPASDLPPLELPEAVVDRGGAASSSGTSEEVITVDMLVANGGGAHSLCGLGNNEDGQLSPVPDLKTNARLVDPGLQPGLSPRIISQKGSPLRTGGAESSAFGWGAVLTMPPDTVEVPTPIAPLAGGRQVKVLGISCGSRHTVCVDSEGLVYAWGWAALGQLATKPGREISGGSVGNGPVAPIAALEVARDSEGPCVEVAAGGMHSACRFQSGHVYTWGMSTFGQLGRGGASVMASKSVCVPGLVFMRQGGAELNGSPPGVASAAPRPPGHQAVLSEDLGLELPGYPLVASSISCGGMHSAAVGASGEVFTWGRGDNGQLGLGRLAVQQVGWPTKVAVLDPTVDPVTLVACGAFHTMAVTTSGALYSWGREEFGCLGIRFDRERMRSGVDKPQRVRLPSGTGRVVGVSCGGAHSLVVDHKGVALSCGKNEHGRLGLGVGTSANSLEFQVVTSFQDDAMGAASVAEEGVKIARAVAGGSHSVFLSRAGDLYACGRQSLGRLGIPGKGGEDDNEGVWTPQLVLCRAADQGSPDKKNTRGPSPAIQAVSAGGQHTCFVLG